MSYPQDSGDRLYALLPAIYRARDRDDDPARDAHLRLYLDAAGSLLDRMRHTLEQLYDDGFPDAGAEGRACQDWMLPYLGRLVAARLRAPFPAGQRAEVANAVRWAQRKGTRVAIEEIAEAVLQSESEVQEGWRRVALTARPGRPLPSARSLGASEPMAPDPAAPPGWTPQDAARHPGLHAATVDFRARSRAIVAPPGSASAEATRFGGAPVWPLDDADPPVLEDAPRRVFWRQVHPHGAPCFPGAYEDVSLRTPDLRAPDAARRRGLFHPRRILVHLPPPQGICAPAPLDFAWDPDLGSLQIGVPAAEARPLSDFVTREIRDGVAVYRNATSHSVRIIGDVEIAGPVRFEKLRFRDALTLAVGRLAMRRCAVGSLVSAAPAEGAEAPPTLDLRDSLLGAVSAPAGSVEMECVTVLGATEAGRLRASEAILAGDVVAEPGGDCLRYSRAPEAYLATLPPIMRRQDHLTSAPPRFVSAEWDAPGCGVLRQDAPAALRQGAEDGGELGAHHAWRHAAGLAALIDKLGDHMPIGTVPVALRDDRLLCPPPTAAGPA